MADFVSSTLAGIVSTVLGGLLTTLILAWTRPQKWKPEGEPALALVGASAGRDINVHVYNSRQLVIQNIQDSKPATSTSSSDDSSLAPLIIVSLLAAGLFVTYAQFILWFMAGVAVGLVISLVAAIMRASKYRLWDSQGHTVVAEVVFAVGAMAYTWMSILSVRHQGDTVAEIGNHVATAVGAEPQLPGFWNSVLRGVLSPAVELTKLGFANGQVNFILMMLGATVFSMLLAWFSWMGIYDWLTYTGFVYGRAKKKGMLKRVARFENRDWKSWLFSAIFCAVACALASGVLFYLSPDTALPIGR